MVPHYCKKVALSHIQIEHLVHYSVESHRWRLVHCSLALLAHLEHYSWGQGLGGCRSAPQAHCSFGMEHCSLERLGMEHCSLERQGMGHCNWVMTEREGHNFDLLAQVVLGCDS